MWSLFLPASLLEEELTADFFPASCLKNDVLLKKCTMSAWEAGPS